MNASLHSETIEHTAAPRPADAPPEPVSTRVRVDVAGRSHAGLVRPNNEDSFLVARLGRTLVTVASNLPAGEVPEVFGEVGHGILVADGVGGGQAGEVAGQKAIASLVNLVLAAPDWIMRIGDEQVEQILDRIAERFRHVGAVVAERAEGDAELAGMATTLTLAYSSGRGPVHRARRGLPGVPAARRRSDPAHPGPHVAQALADAGHIPQPEVERHRLRHVLTRAVGPRGGKSRSEGEPGRAARRGPAAPLHRRTDGMVEEEAIARADRPGADGGRRRATR